LCFFFCGGGGEWVKYLSYLFSGHSISVNLELFHSIQLLGQLI